MIRRAFKKLAGFLRATGAAAALEFAIVAPVFLGTVLGGMQIGIDYYTVASLDKIVAEVGEKISTGQAQALDLNQENFKAQYICPAITTPMDCENVWLDIQSAAGGNFASLQSIASGSVNLAESKFCMGSGGHAVLVRLGYPMPTFISFWSIAGTTIHAGKVVRVFTSKHAFLNQNSFTYTNPGGC